MAGLKVFLACSVEKFLFVALPGTLYTSSIQDQSLPDISLAFWQRFWASLTPVEGPSFYGG